MSRLPRRRSTLLVAAILAALLPGTVLGAGGTIVQVNQTNLGVDWLATTLAGGTGTFAAGPGTPPLGTGSYHLSTLTPDDKATLVTGTWTGAPLAGISGLDYWTYRAATSTSPGYVAPSINIAIFTNADGPGTGFATLVFEPLYAFGNDAIDDGTWQHWDAFAPSQTGFAGGWWTTRAVGAICAVGCYVPFSAFLAAAPDATILSVGVNVGRGPASFIGAVDGLSLTVDGTTTTFDFELLALAKESCKDGGWQDFHAPTYKNQGDCVSAFASAGRQGPKAEPGSAAAAHRSARATERSDKASTKRHDATERRASAGRQDDKASKKDKAEDQGKPDRD